MGVNIKTMFSYNQSSLRNVSFSLLLLRRQSARRQLATNPILAIRCFSVVFARYILGEIHHPLHTKFVGKHPKV
jgi:hypothetical protein